MSNVVRRAYLPLLVVLALSLSVQAQAPGPGAALDVHLPPVEGTLPSPSALPSACAQPCAGEGEDGAAPPPAGPIDDGAADDATGPASDATEAWLWSAEKALSKYTAHPVGKPAHMDTNTPSSEEIVPDAAPQPQPEPEAPEPEPSEPTTRDGPEPEPEVVPQRRPQPVVRRDEPVEQSPSEQPPRMDPPPSSSAGPRALVIPVENAGPALTLVRFAALLAVPAGLAALLAYGPLRGAPLLSLFSHVPKDSALQHPSRRRIHDIVSQQPGICVADVCRLSELSRSTVDYHLDILVRHDLLALRREGKMHHIYARDQNLGRGEKRAYAALRNDRCRRIASYVDANPGANQSAISNALAIPRSRAYEFLRGLQDSGLLEARRQGREIRYFPTRFFSARGPSRGEP